MKKKNGSFVRFYRKHLQGRGSKHGSIFLYSCCCDIKLDHRYFGFSEESLKIEIFFSFFGSFVLKDSIFFLSPSHLRNLAELTEFYRVKSSFNQFNARLVSSIGIDAIRAESITNRLSHIGLGRFFEPYSSAEGERPCSVNDVTISNVEAR